MSLFRIYINGVRRRVDRKVRAGVVGYRWRECVLLEMTVTSLNDTNDNRSAPMRMAASEMGFEFDPTFSNLFEHTYLAYKRYRHNLHSVNYTFPSSTWYDVRRYFHFELGDVVLVVALTVLWTLLRWRLSELVFKPLAKSLHFASSDRQKSPESFWKLIFYTCTVAYNAYLLFGTTDYNFISRITNVWDGWYPGMAVAPEVYFYYMAQGSFYLHSIFATIFMDVWRRDSLAMLIHHVVTAILILFSYALRYTNIGIVVLFLHDVNDAQMEFTRVNVYLKRRRGRIYLLHEWISNVGFLTFTITWMYSRLYWYPTRVLFMSGVVATGKLLLPFTFLLTSLLWVIFLLNIYWFMYIVALLVRVVTGRMSSLEDVREYEDSCDEGTPQTKLMSNGTHPYNNNCTKPTLKTSFLAKSKKVE